VANWSWFTRLHRAVYRRTGGRVGARLAGLDMLLLTTTGRRSGEPRTVPLACFPLRRVAEAGAATPAPDGDWVVVGSNNGQEREPGWWLNLQACPEAFVQLGGERWRARTRLASGAERERLWPELVRRNPAYARYAQRTSREIPVVVLARADP
jgi:F420H(2)-dependent quinone reductase